MSVAGVKESEVEAHLLRRVAELGGVVRKVQWAGRRGAPDRLVLFPMTPWRGPRVLWLELKRPRGGVLSKHQVDEMLLLRQGGMHAGLACTAEEVDEALKDALKGA